MKVFHQLGLYYILIFKVFSKPDDYKLTGKNIIKEIEKLGIDSLGIVVVISLFIGAAITLQSAYNLENPLIPRYMVGLTARDTMLLEFSSTILGLILAGKVGSNIASEIGTMRVTEQIDALEIMGVNSANYLVFPKIIAAMFINPFLTIVSIFLGLIGGWLAAALTGAVSIADYIYGIHYIFIPFYVTYALIKSIVFAFIITSVSSFYGYYTTGGALEVGKSSTKAVVYSSIIILLFNIILTQLLLANK